MQVGETVSDFSRLHATTNQMKRNGETFDDVRILKKKIIRCKI